MCIKMRDCDPDNNITISKQYSRKPKQYHHFKFNSHSFYFFDFSKSQIINMQFKALIFISCVAPFTAALPSGNSWSEGGTLRQPQSSQSNHGGQQGQPGQNGVDGMNGMNGFNGCKLYIRTSKVVWLKNGPISRFNQDHAAFSSIPAVYACANFMADNGFNGCMSSPKDQGPFSEYWL